MKKRVLVVENDKDIRELISLILEEAGYEVSLYINEQEIFEHIVDFEPNAIILDIIRPTLEGTEICADEVVPKPFNIDGLLEILQEQLKNAS